MTRRQMAFAAALVVSAQAVSFGAPGQTRDASPKPLPPGHPALDGGTVRARPLRPTPPLDEGEEGEDGDRGEDELPPGHPSTAGGGSRPQGDPHGGSIPGAFEPPPDSTDEDASLPAGTILVDLRDPDNRLLPGTGVTVGIIHQSVAKGESREHKSLESDERGAARFDKLETGSGIAYRVTVPKDGATFAASPFQLSQTRGMHVLLHVYPVVHNVQDAVIVIQTVIFAELKDDRVQLEEAISVYNFGKSAWVPDGVVMKLPVGFTAVTAGQQMGDQGVDSIDKQGAKLRGTFAPGRKDIDFRWQLPYGGEKEVDFVLGLPPHVAVMRVIALASQDMHLLAENFPDAQKHNDPQGQHLLVTERQLRRDDSPLTSVHVTLKNLPGPGPGRIVAACLAGLGMALGFVFAFSGVSEPAGKPGRGKGARTRLLAELEDLERARLANEIGPKTYDRTRRELIDAIARTLETASADTAKD